MFPGQHSPFLMNKPPGARARVRQVTAMQTWNDVSILAPTEKVDELRVKLWQGSVEVTELLQRTCGIMSSIEQGNSLDSSEQAICRQQL